MTQSAGLMKASQEDRNTSFAISVANADRIEVHKLNALGEYDTESFNACQVVPVEFADMRIAALTAELAALQERFVVEKAAKVKAQEITACPRCQKISWQRDKDGPANLFCSSCGHEDYDDTALITGEAT